MMMHLHPDRVRTDLLPDAPSLGTELEEGLRRLGAEGQASFAWLAGDLNPGGTVGNAGLADAAMGERLVEGYASALADVLMDARDFPLDRLEP